jgi:uncharacterized protein YbjT (DUF2867 family)
MTKKAIIVGASGLIGSKLLNILLVKQGYSEVLSISRKKLKLENVKLTQKVIDFDHLADYSDLITGHAIFCCLGSTRNQTPDLAEYRKIDHDYPIELAKIAFKNSVQEYHLISSIGANAGSSNFYTKMKGETEADLKAVGVPSVHIYQPSILIGHRKKPRKTERFAIGFLKIFSPFFWGGLKKYRPIAAQDVASAMYNQSLKNKKGVFTYTSDQIQKRT